MGEFNSDNPYFYYCGQKSLRRNVVALIVNKRVWNAGTWAQSQKQQDDLIHFQEKPFNITVIKVYAPISRAGEAEVEIFYDHLQDLLELTHQKEVLFITGDCNAKVESQEIPGVTGKFGLGVQNEAGQRLTKLCQENTLVIANTFFQQHKRWLHMDITRWSTPKSYWLYSLQSKMEKLYTVSKTRPGADCGSDHKFLIAKFRLNWRKQGKPLGHS